MPPLATICWLALSGSVALWGTTLTSLISYYEIRQKEFLESQLRQALKGLPLMPNHGLTPQSLLSEWRDWRLQITTIPDLLGLLISVRTTLFVLIAIPLFLNLTPIVIASWYGATEATKHVAVFEIIEAFSILVSATCAVGVLLTFRGLQIAEAFRELVLWNSWGSRKTSGDRRTGNDPGSEVTP
jgi:hypothetical protein